MWIYKALGTLLLACSGVMAATELNRVASAALRQNEGMMALLRTVRGQIECFSLPIGTILGTCEKEVLFSCGYGRDGAPRDLDELLAYTKVWDARSVAIVSQFALEFGRGYREDEVRACDYALSLLEERRAALAAELPVRKKRNATLTICASLALALLLL